MSLFKGDKETTDTCTHNKAQKRTIQQHMYPHNTTHRQHQTTTVGTTTTIRQQQDTMHHHNMQVKNII